MVRQRGGDSFDLGAGEGGRAGSGGHPDGQGVTLGGSLGELAQDRDGVGARSSFSRSNPATLTAAR